MRASKSSKHACERVGRAYLVRLLTLFMSSSESSTLKGGQVTQTINPRPPKRTKITHTSLVSSVDLTDLAVLLAVRPRGRLSIYQLRWWQPKENTSGNTYGVAVLALAVFTLLTLLISASESSKLNSGQAQQKESKRVQLTSLQPRHQ